MIRPIAKFLLPTNQSQFRLRDDLDSAKWNDFVMNGEKVTIYDDKLVFKTSGKIFTLRGDVLKMITDYKFITTDSRDAKLIIDFMEEMHFDIHPRGKSLVDKNLTYSCFIKRSILASGLKTVSFQNNRLNYLIN